MSSLHEGSIRAQGSEPMWDVAFVFGHTFEDNRTFLYGGLKFQTMPLSGKYHQDDAYIGTKEHMPILLFVGAIYNFSDKKL
ncbi:MAG: hypothetical protein ACK5L5_07130 [Bacteroidales bacterium]